MANIESYLADISLVSGKTGKALTTFRRLLDDLFRGCDIHQFPLESYLMTLPQGPASAGCPFISIRLSVQVLRFLFPFSYSTPKNEVFCAGLFLFMKDMSGLR